MRLSAAVLAAASLVLCATAPEFVWRFWPLLAVFGAIAVGFAQRSIELAFEYLILPLSLPLLYVLGATHPLALALAPLVALVILAFHPFLWPTMLALAAALAATLWFLAASPVHLCVADVLALALGLATAAVYLATRLTRSASPAGNLVGRSVDLLLCSYSGNTANYADAFAAGARGAGAQVSVHRFQHAASFQAALDGHALVIAFPVIGWKPPWPLFWYLLRRLPAGHGRRVFILFTCGGGPENTAVLLYLLLTLKGYRVAGHDWGLYPLNLVRPGPSSIWRWLDRLVTPGPQRLAAPCRTGAAFVRGELAGLPLILWASPLFLIGPLLDNRWFDWLISHNHVFRRRCNGCGLCVRFCPVARLALVDGVPRSQAITCAFCFGCVNICPRHAMHLWLMTELGQPYRQFEAAMKRAARRGDKVMKCPPA